MGELYVGEFSQTGEEQQGGSINATRNVIG